MGASSTDLTLTPPGYATVSGPVFPRAQAVWVSALSVFSSQDTNLPSIKIAVVIFLLFGSNREASGKRLPGYYLCSRIFSAFPCDTVSKQHIIQQHPALFLKSAPLRRLRHLSISILTSSPTHFPHFHYV